MPEEILDFFPLLASCESLAQTTHILGCYGEPFSLHYPVCVQVEEVSSSLRAPNGLVLVVECTVVGCMSRSCWWSSITVISSVGTVQMSFSTSAPRVVQVKFLPFRVLNLCSGAGMQTYNVQMYSSASVHCQWAYQWP